MSDKRKTGEGAMRGWQTKRKRALSHNDLCRLSACFNERANLRLTQDQRINDWLRAAIAKAEEKR